MSTIALSGSIGSGKTSILQATAQVLGWASYPEPAMENPYLVNAFRYPSRWGFHSEMWFLHQKIKLLDKIHETREPVLFERTVYEDRLFAKVLLAEPEYDLYLKWWTIVADQVVNPALIILLEVTEDEAFERIIHRKHAYDLETTRELIHCISRQYSLWMATIPKECLVRVSTSGRTHESVLNEVVETILKRAKGRQIDDSKH